MIKKLTILLSVTLYSLVSIAAESSDINLSNRAFGVLKGKKILYNERYQFARDHHNTATIFEYGEVNQSSFRPGAAFKIFDVDTREITTILETNEGVIRDPEISYDGTKILFAWRKSFEESSHIYEMNIDGTGIRQLTFAEGISDIDPAYLPDGGIVFSSTREPKYCMCNRHIMVNLFRMNPDGSNITQIGVSTLFEGHPAVLNDGRIIYDRWEYVDRNFGDAQGLWTVNPDGTKHAIYYGNNTLSPGAVLDARPIPGSNEIVCTFSSCHDRPWGAFVILDRSKGVDGEEPVVEIFPRESRELVKIDDFGAYLKETGIAPYDAFKRTSEAYEDPFPIDHDNFFVSRTLYYEQSHDGPTRFKKNVDMGIFLVNRDGYEELILDGELPLFEAMLIEPRPAPPVIPFMRDFESDYGTFYVQDVYEGTHMEGVERGAVKWLRIVESPPKRTWLDNDQSGKRPNVNWSSLEMKKVYGVVPVEEDGSASFKAPAGTFVFFQVLDKDMKMIQSMRSGVSLMPGETNGCIGCHEDRLMLPKMGAKLPIALQKKPLEMEEWMDKDYRNYSYLEKVQPVLDRKCMKCHDFDQKDREKLVLAGDKELTYNTSYFNIYSKKLVKLVGAGPGEIQQAYSWGSYPSALTQVIENKMKKHPKVKLSAEERAVIYEWMDLNGLYYPTYETSFDEGHMLGRSPMTYDELAELTELTGVEFARYRRAVNQAPISFDRPEESVCLDSIRKDKAKFARAVELIKMGSKRLEETPRGDIESELVLCEMMRLQLENYANRLKANNTCYINIDETRYDKK